MDIVEKRMAKYSVRASKRWQNVSFRPTADHKIRIRLCDGNMIEAGAFELLVNGTREVHACISTQAGCKYGCSMCTSGKRGFYRNLSVGEILGQIRLLAETVAVPVFDRVAFMGIGEPLDNYDNFVQSVTTLTTEHKDYMGRLSFATVGLPDRLLALVEERLPPFRSLWVSLHAPSDDKRGQIMPIARSFSIKDTLDAAKQFARSTTAGVCLNYMLFLRFNDSIMDAHALATVISGTEDIFSLLITEPNADLPRYEAAGSSDLQRFEVYLRECGVKNRIFQFVPAGTKVDAGCGEFVFGCP